jgi:putative PIN family toxin of toxin-antitoxin system
MKVEPEGRLRRVVLDTNVWISAVLSNRGSPARVLRLVLDRCCPVFSDVTFAELETRLQRPKFDRYLSLDLRRRILHDVNAVADWVDIPPAIAAQTWCRDADDDHFIRVALAARARLLVTGDADLLDLPAVDELRILTPAQVLREGV